MRRQEFIRPGSCFRTVTVLAASLLALAMLIVVQPAAAAPLAGTSIGNQASATYTDASAVVRTATSNTVQTIVQQVASLSLTASQARTGAAGGTVYFPHTLTNTGNGSDSFTISRVDANTGTINFTSINAYPDTNGDGVPDNFTPITGSGSLAPGATYTFIVAATISGASVNGDTDTITVSAASAFTPAVTASNTDTVNVSGNAIIVMTKAVSPGSGDSGSGPLTYTLTYTNTGNATATNLVITDVLPVSGGITYNGVGNTARWSVAGATALTDAADGVQTFAPYTINYDAATVANTVTATINQVLPGESRTLTFEVLVSASAAPGVISNTATFTYNDGAVPNKSGSTNSTPFTVNQSAAVVANGSNASNVDGTAEPVTVASALQGGTITFPAYVWNTGNGSDSFDITIASGTFPAGTSFVLYKSDGVTPLIDTNSNSIPDTGVLAASGSYNVVVKAILPANAVGGPFSATLTATSKLDGTKSNTAALVLTTITGNTIDLTLTTARSDSTPPGTAAAGNAASTGFGSYVPASAALTPHATSNPGATTTFVLKVNNTSLTSDTYNLAAGGDENFTTPVPTGWTVVFKADASVAKDCSTVGAIIANTGVVSIANNTSACAVVTAPANAAAATQDLYFRALSPTSSANDRLRLAIDVNAVRSVIVTNSQTGQIFPGGTVVYPMTVTNNGNVTEGTVAGAGTPNGSTNSKVVIGLSDSLAAQGWTSVLYHDANGNGTIDPTDPVISDLSVVGGLAPGSSVPLLVKVFAPAGAGIGDTNVSTLTATITGTINGSAAPAASSATATSTVISGQVTLTKEQGLDAACDGTADGAGFGQSNLTTGAVPGACILYRITARNVGTAAITTLDISDATPANTVYATGCIGSSVAAAAVSTGSITQTPAACGPGTVKAAVPTLAPGASVVVTFGVKINP